MNSYYNFSPTYVQYPSFQTQIVHWRSPFREGAKDQLFDEICIRVSTLYNDGKVYTQDYIINDYDLSMKNYDLHEIIDYLTDKILKTLENESN